MAVKDSQTLRRDPRNLCLESFSGGDLRREPGCHASRRIHRNPVHLGLSNPTAFAFAPDGRLFVSQQGGQLRVVKNGTLLSTPFLTVSVDSTGERGLLGVAFDPAFATNHFVYVYYTVSTSPHFNRVSRFTANGDVAAAGSEVLILQLEDLSSATNHNGGAIHFGPDGKLYVAVGENANGSNAQTLSNKLGKMLRINPDGSIPTDNPFFNTASGDNRGILALGLRNPFTFAFQPGTGRMFINDVGQSTWEEINDGIAGSNYGWPTTEGFTSNPRSEAPCWPTAMAAAAPPDAPSPAALSTIPRSTAIPQFSGQYFYADYCIGMDPPVHTPPPGQSSGFATSISSPVDLAVGPTAICTTWPAARAPSSGLALRPAALATLTLDGVVNVVDVQRMVLVVLGAASRERGRRI